MIPRKNCWIIAVPVLIVLWLQNNPVTVSFVPPSTSSVDRRRLDGATANQGQRTRPKESAPTKSNFRQPDPTIEDSISAVSTAPYPWPSKQSREALEAFYIYHPKNTIDSDAWRSICPPASGQAPSNGFLVPFTRKREPPSNRRHSLDISKVWSMEHDDDPHQVASDMVRECLHFHCGNGCRGDYDNIDFLNDSMVKSVAESLCAYRDFCVAHLPLEEHLGKNRRRVSFKCRLVATLGTTGAKCPQFHIDHVPVRWIQTFVGPGVEIVVGNNGVRWDAFCRDDDTDEENENDAILWTPKERNKQLVDMNVANVYCAPPGEAVLILGNEWNQCVTQSSSKLIIQPVVHKSPEISQLQPRVLLTQDIIIE